MFSEGHISPKKIINTYVFYIKLIKLVVDILHFAISISGVVEADEVRRLSIFA